MENGYSGNPLAKKLGVKAGQKAWQVGMPTSVRSQIAVDIPGFKFAASVESPISSNIFGARQSRHILTPRKYPGPSLTRWSTVGSSPQPCAGSCSGIPTADMVACSAVGFLGTGALRKLGQRSAHADRRGRLAGRR